MLIPQQELMLSPEEGAIPLKAIRRITEKAFTRSQPEHGDLNRLSFANGAFFIQHHPEALKDIREHLLQSAYRRVSEYASFIDNFLNSQKVNVVDDLRLFDVATDFFDQSVSIETTENMNEIRAFSKAFSRVSCMDLEKGIEWGQPYFVNNPNASAVCLNPGEALAKWEKEQLSQITKPFDKVDNGVDLSDTKTTLRL